MFLAKCYTQYVYAVLSKASYLAFNKPLPQLLITTVLYCFKANWQGLLSKGQALIIRVMNHVYELVFSNSTIA